MLGYLAALPLLYICVYLPLSSIILGTSHKPAVPAVTSMLNNSLIATNEALSCPSHKYNTHILSLEPLVIYIEDFLSAEESRHLLEISEDKFEASTVSTGARTSIQRDVRDSEVALVDRDDVVRCIEHRARDFQGWRPDLHIERLRTQRYGVGGHYAHHYDWSGASRDADRVSTFMVYVDADCEGGGTEFPRIPMPDTSNGRWCELLKCEETEDGAEDRDRRSRIGVTFKPKTGNAVFWENLRPDGTGYEETLHAGLPVLSGSKVGLNIWSWGPARRRLRWQTSSLGAVVLFVYFRLSRKPNMYNRDALKVAQIRAEVPGPVIPAEEDNAQTFVDLHTRSTPVTATAPVPNLTSRCVETIPKPFVSLENAASRQSQLRSSRYEFKLTSITSRGGHLSSNLYRVVSLANAANKRSQLRFSRHEFQAHQYHFQGTSQQKPIPQRPFLLHVPNPVIQSSCDQAEPADRRY
ncbi:hypothetical protein MBM_08740 [Drepanopeziza brunnea f. sp. 'multigermtubi' MB_m1]|uniref:Fe2OG dioxygenase domain-containing protein n=1 Tax=Marssonina brunnea f. sp. multigermtubi (strain MB_m1) TaxID=1072389 RepID=K1WWC1_MARBU|nr:uncharacterized protein MBM_08740 [Drepanopeziza brunnea f. sp. 'multigermtubi' MB_m1]EKD12978.1 hypothetical protein MBM_08740 [Drepanopeziza brunnea f. sp. 'multigermtubi' MB_m1]